MTPLIRAISPEVVATTVAAAQRLESPELAARFERQPRLVELLWFLQHFSTQPGGLCGLVRSLVQRCPEFIGPEHPPCPKNPSSMIKTLLGLAQRARDEILGEFSDDFAMEHGERDELFEDLSNGAVHALRSTRPAALSARLKGITNAEIQAVCAGAAQAQLPAFFARLCSEPNHTLYDQAFWYCRRPVEALLRLMDITAAEAPARLADTSARRQVMEALDYAWEGRQPVWIHGNPRLGKTATIQAYCAAYPGRARLVRVPCSESDVDLLRAVASALGLHHGPNIPGWQLRQSIGWILGNAGLMLILDEAHFLLPGKAAGNASPSRLNWVRTEIVDRDLPCVLCTTPQSYAYAEQRFRKKAASYPMEQWLGRWVYQVKLPDQPSQDDLYAVGRRYFPDLPKAVLDELVSRGLQHDGMLKAIESVSVRAAFLSRRSGHPSVSTDDVRRAMEEMLPKAFRMPVAEPLQASSKQPETSRFSRPTQDRQLADPIRRSAEVAA